MKLIKATQIVGLILLSVVVAGSVLAQRQGAHSGSPHSGSRSGIAHYGSHWGTSRYYGGHYHSGSHVGVGVYFGGPAYWYYPWPYYYPPAYYYSPYYPYYYPPAQAYSPPAYVEQGTSTERFESNWWYYCAGSDRYYPYVKECPGGWQRVTPQPPPAG